MIINRLYNYHMKMNKIVKYIIIMVIVLLVINLNTEASNDIQIEEVEGNFFSIFAKKLEELLVGIVSFVFSLIKKVFNLFFSI